MKQVFLLLNPTGFKPPIRVEKFYQYNRRHHHHNQHVEITTTPKPTSNDMASPRQLPSPVHCRPLLPWLLVMTSSCSGPTQDPWKRRRLCSPLLRHVKGTLWENISEPKQLTWILVRKTSKTWPRWEAIPIKETIFWGHFSYTPCIDRPTLWRWCFVFIVKNIANAVQVTLWLSVAKSQCHD